MANPIIPFRISVGDEVLADLRSRLRNTRWPEAEPVGDWSQGTRLAWRSAAWVVAGSAPFA